MTDEPTAERMYTQDPILDWETLPLREYDGLEEAVEQVREEQPGENVLVQGKDGWPIFEVRWFAGEVRINAFTPDSVYKVADDE